METLGAANLAHLKVTKDVLIMIFVLSARRFITQGSIYKMIC